MFLKFPVIVILTYLLSVDGTFVQRKVTVSIPSDFPPGAPIFHVTAIDDVTGRKIGSDRFVIARITSSPVRQDESSLRSLFSLDTHSAAVLISPHRETALSDYKGRVFSLEISDVELAKEMGRRAVTTLVIHVSNETSGHSAEEFCKPRKELCFSYGESRLLVPETAEVGTVVASLKPLSLNHLCPELTYSYHVSGKGPLAVSEPTGQLELIHLLDYETKLNYSFNVSCQISRELHQSSINAIFTKAILLAVKDVNDNPPHLQEGSDPNDIIDSYDVIPGRPLPVQYTVLDPDSKAVNNISISLDDPLGLFYQKKPVYFYDVNGNEMLVNVAVVPKNPFVFPGKSYTLGVIFDDNKLITKNNSKVVFHTKVVNKSIEEDTTKLSPEIHLNISRYLGLYSRVIQPLDVQISEGFYFQLGFIDPKTSDESEKIFAITQRTGIIYINDAATLQTTSHHQFRFRINWQKTEYPKKSSILIISVDETDIRDKICPTIAKNLPPCSMHDREETCEASCGRGAPRGSCQWRKHKQPFESRQTSRYATCTAEIGTCPDGHCDELEEMDTYICPQDCTTIVNGEGVMNYRGRGIWMAAAPCTCDGRGTCMCMKRPSAEEIQERREKERQFARERKRRKQKQQWSNNNKSDNSISAITTVATSIGAESKSKDEVLCDVRCTAVIASVSLIVVTLVAVAIVVLFRHVRLSRSEKHKYVAGRMPLAAVGSDYVDDRTQQQPPPPPAIVESSTEDSPVDSKWEFPRDKLILQELLGEGEFGKVVKAQAWNIANRPGYTTVAVKTLKDNGTLSEEQDLLSELNLLRDVSHPNVVQLLGACTSKGGPLCIIVEYAELGALSAYLKKLRQCVVPLNLAINNPSYFGNIDSSISLTYQEVSQELLSFAWQIAKGMSYLSDMKLVHRDLAARNILLAKNKVVKISDFGLSRDVYEGDTYLKTTKGRVPVKWMAIESLEDHIYTIKSDVWSYGVVLWEIITLGATPYPGITPERLYHLLKGGYRMPKPDSCPSELYSIMRKCWREIPHERPSFKELVSHLDKLLQDTVEYLPLGPGDMIQVSTDSTNDGDVKSSQQEDKNIKTSSPLSNQDRKNSRSAPPANHSNRARKMSALHFGSSDGNEYENRLLLPNSSERCEASG